MGDKCRVEKDVGCFLNELSEVNKRIYYVGQNKK